MQLTQHASFHEFEHYARGYPASALARRLRCKPSTVHAWASGKRPPPWWTVAVLRLDSIEREEMARQMGYAHLLPKLGIVRGAVVQFPNRPRREPSPIPQAAPSANLLRA